LRGPFFSAPCAKVRARNASAPQLSGKGLYRPAAGRYLCARRDGTNDKGMARKKEKGRNLTLSIKRKYFDEILSGAKTSEEREVWPHNVYRYCLMDGEGRTLMEEGIGIVPRPYDTITFLTGACRGTRPRMVVEVSSSAVYGEEGEDGENVTYEYDDGETYELATVVYELGRILERPPAPGGA